MGGGGVKTPPSSISDEKKKGTANFGSRPEGRRRWISLDTAIVVATDAPVCEDPAKHSITPRTRSSK